MKKLHFFFIALLFLGITSVKAQFSDIYNFSTSTGYTPYGSLVFDGTKYYGMTAYGGTSTPCGVVFSINPDGSGYTVLHYFTNAINDGSFPFGSLIVSGGVLYGMTSSGGIGAYADGIIFSIHTDGSSFTDLHNFTGSHTDGADPDGDLTLSGGVLYGMTLDGGAYTNGIIFSMNINGSSFTDLHDFSGSTTDGSQPNGNLILSGNVLYGMGQLGGIDNKGIVFSMNTNGSSFTDLHDFTESTTDGAYPLGGLTLSGNVLYGMAFGGNSLEEGLIFTYTLPITCNLTATASATNVSCHGGNNGSATAIPASGTAPYTYLWSDAGSQTNVTASGLSAGSYTVTIQDAASCSATASVTITQPASALSAGASITSNVSCNGGNNGSATATPASGTSPFTYLWSDATSATTATVNNLTFGTYTVIVNDANNCSATSSVTITQPSALLYASAGVVNNVLCQGASNGKATATAVGGVSPYTYSWINASSSTVATIQSPNTLSAGSFTVTIRDNCGASVSASVTITQPRAVFDSIVSVINVGCHGGNGGTATAGARGGTYPYKYSWSSGSTLVTASGLSAGTYTLTVTDQNGCSATNAAPVASISQPPALSISLSSLSAPVCNGGYGTGTVSVTGGVLAYTYTWTGGLSTTATCTKLIAGSYTVSVKDKNGCSSSVGFTMTQPAAIRDSSITSDKLNVGCNGGNTGGITLGTKYGTAPYTYAWSPNVSTSNVAGSLTAGTYTISVTDHRGCSSSGTVAVTQPAAALSASFTSKTCSNSLVKVTASPTGGTSPYTYLWSPGGKTTAMLSGLTPGSYSVTITDMHGCSYTLTSTLSCPEIKPKDEENHSTNNCCGGEDNITLYPNPTSGQFTIQSSVVSGQLSVEIYNMLGQKVYAQFNIQNPTFNISIADQPNGIYLIRILDNTGNLVSQKKVVKTN